MARSTMETEANQLTKHPKTSYHTRSVKGVDVFYREAGSKQNPALVLLHGFPTSSHMFRDLIPELANHFYVIAPDYPGFGNSGMPDRKAFHYTFDKYAEIIDTLLNDLQVKQYALYIFDYGAPVGFRLFQKHPERITAFISQNGNAYEEGITGFWDPIKAYWRTGGTKEREAIRWLTSLKATRWQYENGVPKDKLALINPDAWHHDQHFLDRPGNQEIQLDLFYDYRTNLPLYSIWQKALNKHQPPMLVVWGKNDEIFVAPGGEAYKRDLKNVEIHMLDTGHFTLETHGYEIAAWIIDFLKRTQRSRK